MLKTMWKIKEKAAVNCKKMLDGITQMSEDLSAGANCWAHICLFYGNCVFGKYWLSIDYLKLEAFNSGTCRKVASRDNLDF